MELTIKQTIALDLLEDDKITEVYYGGAAGGGKSMLGCYWQLKRRFKYPGTRGLMGRSELKNLKRTTLNSFFEVCKIQGLKAEKHYSYNQQNSVIIFPNKSEIILADLFSYPSDPNFDSLGSLEITDAFIDEAPQVTEKAKNTVRSRIRYKMTEYNLIPKMFMSGNPSKGWPYNEFYKPSRDGSMRADRAFIQALPGDNPYLPDSYIESLKGLDRNSRERLLDGNWEYDDDPTVLIDYDKIIDCFTNNYLPTGEGCITADIARFGSDNTCIGVWSGNRVRLISYHGKSVSEVAEIIKKLQEQHQIPNSQTICDEDGVGGGVVDILKCRGFVNNSRPFPNPVTRDDDNFTNLKSQCYFKLAEVINAGKLFIDCDNVNEKQFIIQELENVKQYRMDKDSKRQVLPKDKVKELIGRSPDFADTLMMKMWYEFKPAYKQLWVG